MIEVIKIFSSTLPCRALDSNLSVSDGIFCFHDFTHVVITKWETAYLKIIDGKIVKIAIIICKLNAIGFKIFNVKVTNVKRES